MTFEEIENKAEEIATSFNPDGLSPFPFEKIQQGNPDIKILVVDIAERISGAISYDPDTNQFSIFINTLKPDTRQQFTIAHELGHYYLHQEIIKSEDGLVDFENTLDGNNILYRLDGAQSTKVETEANRFAATLIMPRRLIEKAWAELKSVEECAKVFNVSVSAMSIRLEKLGLLR